jgi:hypothetical protein
MSTLTLKKVPEQLLELLREDAERDRRSVNQHALWLLERALAARRAPSFGDALTRFRERHAADLGGDFDVPRDRSPGRPVDL